MSSAPRKNTWYALSPFRLARRPTRVVHVGGLGIGGSNPLRVQTMTNTDTMDTESTVAQAGACARAGAEIVRITAASPREARNLAAIKAGLLKQGCRVPLAADIHFSPEAAMEAALHVEKVRINPGNFACRKRPPSTLVTPAEAAMEWSRVRERFKPLVELCLKKKRALRIGVNHGSLADRVLVRFGDTAEGMVQSALEFAREARKMDFHGMLFSMKASNPKIMIQAYRLLALRMNEEGMDYPLHLGVTEAGAGEDGILRGAAGIGALLEDGLGDTIRVSLTGSPQSEIPVAQNLAARYFREGRQRKGFKELERSWAAAHVPGVMGRRKTNVWQSNGLKAGGTEPVEILVPRDFKPGTVLVLDADKNPRVVLGKLEKEAAKAGGSRAVLAVIRGGRRGRFIHLARMAVAWLDRRGLAWPLCLAYGGVEKGEDLRLSAATVFGSLLSDGTGDAVALVSKSAGPDPQSLCLDILQAAGARLSRAEIISCPTCGRTLFDLAAAAERVKARFGHLKGLRIAVMGCVVNGPGEMADADFGLVGAAKGTVNIYAGRECVKTGVPLENALKELELLIRSRGRWVEP